MVFKKYFCKICKKVLVQDQSGSLLTSLHYHLFSYHADRCIHTRLNITDAPPMFSIKTFELYVTRWTRALLLIASCWLCCVEIRQVRAWTSRLCPGKKKNLSQMLACACCSNSSLPDDSLVTWNVCTVECNACCIQWSHKQIHTYVYMYNSAGNVKENNQRIHSSARSQATRPCPCNILRCTQTQPVLIVYYLGS